MASASIKATSHLDILLMLSLKEDQVSKREDKHEEYIFGERCGVRRPSVLCLGRLTSRVVVAWRSSTGSWKYLLRSGCLITKEEIPGNIDCNPDVNPGCNPEC